MYMMDKLMSFNLSDTNFHHMLDVLEDPAEMNFFLCSKSAAIHSWFEDKIPGYTRVKELPFTCGRQVTLPQAYMPGAREGQGRGQRGRGN